MRSIKDITCLVVAAALWMTPAGAVDGENRTAADGTMTEQPVADSDSPRQPLVFIEREFEGVPMEETRLMASQRRGAVAGPIPDIFLLVPEMRAVTTQAQPSLFWYLSCPANHPIKLTLNSPGNPAPIVELTYDPLEMTRGIHRLDLSRLNVRLHPGLEYEWVATIVIDPRKPEKNRFTKSLIWRIAAPPGLSQQMRAAKSMRTRAKIAGQEGIWIDALDWITDLVDANPQDRALRRDQADLLRHAEYRFDVNNGLISFAPRRSSPGTVR